MLRHRFPTIVAILAVASCCLAAKPKPGKSDGVKTDAKGQPIQPADAQYTLCCAALEGPGHVEQANTAKEQLVKLCGLKDFYVVHQEGQSVIYFGFYKTLSDKSAVRDRKMLEAMTDTPGKDGGNRLFNHVFLVPVSEPDPAAPAEWNLANSKGYWSWQIAAYKDSPHRKQAAVDAVRDARARGIDAYFYHGETTSSVCIGSWPKEAVMGEDDEAAGVATDPGQDVIVHSAPIPENQKVSFHNREGDRVRDITPTYKAVDASLISTMGQYPVHSVNGETVVTKANGKVMEDPAFLVKIKQPEATILRAANQPPELLAPQTVTPAAGTIGAAQPAAPGPGKLRSIGVQ
jgi:hypothetical protein